MDQYGVQWECTQEDYNTTTTNGRLMLNLKLSIAQNESDICSSCGNIWVVNCGKSKKTGKYSRPIYLCGKKYTTGKPKAAGGCQFGGGVSERVIEQWLIKNIFPLLQGYEATAQCLTGPFY